MPRAVSEGPGAATARVRPARLLTRPQLLARRPAGVHGRGVLLSQGSLGAAARWARRGIGAVTVAGLDGWTVVVPDGPAAARPPYDDAVRSLAGRPVPPSLRPALGVFHVGRQIVLTVHLPAGVGEGATTPEAGAGRGVHGLFGRLRVARTRLAAWRPRSGWLIWTPREGLVAPEGLPEASVADVVIAAVPWRRARRRDALAAEGESALAAETAPLTDALAGVLADGTLEPSAVLAEVFGILSLPGHELFGGATLPADLPGARQVRPSPRATRAFERTVAEENRHLDEMSRS